MAEGEWESGLCNCFANLGVCLITYFLPCVTFAQNADEAGTCGFVPALICFFVPVVDYYLLIKTRMDTREKFNIPGGFCGDLITSLLCPFCVMIQTKHQLNQSKMGETIQRV